MIRFECDYAEGAHPLILQELITTNMEQTAGYGEDKYCDQAKSLIKEACNNADLDIYFLVGGTQTNLLAISSVLKPFQGVIAADSGHISTHETGAIEATGHKVLTILGDNGKIKATQIKELVINHLNDESRIHTVAPKMVYLSQPTEFGTLYSLQELKEIKDICAEYDLSLFIDGARLGYGLAAETNDVSLADLSELCDLFYIGGTKVGALFGEALIIKDHQLAQDIHYMIKQRGALLAKGRMLGIQFKQLFTNNLYYKIAQQADEYAMLIKDAFKQQGFSLLYETYTNQLFPILTNEQINELRKSYAFHIWQNLDQDHSAIRICTSWATTEESVQQLIQDIKKL